MHVMPAAAAMLAREQHADRTSSSLQHADRTSSIPGPVSSDRHNRIRMTVKVKAEPFRLVPAAEQLS